MPITPFQLERYFAKYEFSARYLLSSSDCESLTMQEMLGMADRESLDMWEQLKLGYTESWGHPVLREEISRVYQSITPPGVLTVVPEEGIYLTMRALLKPGDHVICTFPGYQSLYEIARSIGCEVSHWEPDESQGWKFSITDLAQLIRSNTRLVVVNFPHNPTGYVPVQDDFVSLVELVRQNNAHLLSDEMYRHLEIKPGTTLPAACDLYERAISLFGLSKTFGLPGLRVGWLASQDAELLEEISRLKDYTTICGSAPSEVLAIIALRNKESIINKQTERVRRNVTVLENFVTAHLDQVNLVSPIGGSICFPRLLSVDNTYDFGEQLVAETGIMIAPSRLFQYGDHHLRIGVGRENFPEVLALFGRYFDQHANSS
jgi:aspartate/methionine/tyrosine aminotransferase